MRVLLVTLLAASTIQPTAARAQTQEGGDLHLRNDCRLAAQVLRTGQPAPRMEWALATIGDCSDSGPATVAETWRTASPGTLAVAGRLAGATRRFNDRVVVEAVMDVARSPAYPDAYRVQAMALLYSYAVPGVYLYVEDLTGPEPYGRRHWTMSGDDYVRGARETLGDFVPELRALLGEIVATEPESAAGIAAARVLRRLP